MYICLDCGNEFTHPKTIEEKHGDPFQLREKHRVSPCCHSTFAEAMRCGGCNALIAAGADCHGLCRKCAERAVDRLRYLLLNEFTEAEREALDEAFDGVFLTEPDKAKVIIP